MTAQLTTNPDHFTMPVPVSVSASGNGVRLSARTAVRGTVDIFLTPSELCGLMEMYGQIARNECEPTAVVRVAE